MNSDKPRTGEAIENTGESGDRTEPPVLRGRKVHIGCEACEALKLAQDMPTGSEFLFFAGLGIGRKGDELALCEVHMTLMRTINGVTDPKLRGNYGVWAIPPKKGIFGDLKPRFQLCRNEVWRCQKDEAEAYAKICNDEPHTDWKYEVRLIPDGYTHPSTPSEGESK
jgi:hypothetical protein